jgi:hypothetical protein
VKRGEKGILILAPMVGRKKPTDEIATEVESNNSADDRKPQQQLYGFVPCMCSTDYLVICGRAPARSKDAASATLESPFDSSKHIIAQLLCPVQPSLLLGAAGVPAIGRSCPPIRVLSGNGYCLLQSPSRRDTVKIKSESRVSPALDGIDSPFVLGQLLWRQLPICRWVEA